MTPTAHDGRQCMKMEVIHSENRKGTGKDSGGGGGGGDGEEM